MRSLPLVSFLAALAAAALASPAHSSPAPAGDTPIRLPRDPALSPDGALLAFAWQGDVWVASSSGGEARRLTLHGADDAQPTFHPSGAELAFVSERSGSPQIHVVSLDGGEPRQVTFDTLRKTLLGYTADGGGFVVSMASDRGFAGSESTRVYVLDAAGVKPKRMLLDAGLRSAIAAGIVLLFLPFFKGNRPPAGPMIASVVLHTLMVGFFIAGSRITRPA